jgi:hypothetical protein
MGLQTESEITIGPNQGDTSEFWIISTAGWLIYSQTCDYLGCDPTGGPAMNGGVIVTALSSNTGDERQCTITVRNYWNEFSSVLVTQEAAPLPDNVFPLSYSDTYGYNAITHQADAVSFYSIEDGGDNSQYENKRTVLINNNSDPGDCDDYVHWWTMPDGYKFPFYDIEVSELGIATNGAIIMGNENHILFVNQQLINSGLETSILPYWDDLKAYGTGGGYSDYGVKLVAVHTTRWDGWDFEDLTIITWKNFKWYGAYYGPDGGDFTISMQVFLFGKDSVSRPEGDWSGNSPLGRPGDIRVMLFEDPGADFPAITNLPGHDTGYDESNTVGIINNPSDYFIQVAYNMNETFRWYSAYYYNYCIDYRRPLPPYEVWGMECWDADGTPTLKRTDLMNRFLFGAELNKDTAYSFNLEEYGWYYRTTGTMQITPINMDVTSLSPHFVTADTGSSTVEINPFHWPGNRVDCHITFFLYK